MSTKQVKAMELKDKGQDIEIMSESQFLSMLGVEFTPLEKSCVETKSSNMSFEISIDLDSLLSGR